MGANPMILEKPFDISLFSYIASILFANVNFTHVTARKNYATVEINLNEQKNEFSLVVRASAGKSRPVQLLYCFR